MCLCVSLVMNILFCGLTLFSNNICKRSFVKKIFLLSDIMLQTPTLDILELNYIVKMSYDQQDIIKWKS